MIADFDHLRQLPLEVKLQLIDLLWEDIASSEPILPDSVRAEMERRAAELEADPSIGLTEEEFWERVDHSRG